MRRSSSNKVFKKWSSQGTWGGRWPKSGKEVIRITYSSLSEEKVLRSERLTYAPSGYAHLSLEHSPKPAMPASPFFQPTMNLAAWDTCKTTVINHVSSLQNNLQWSQHAFSIYVTLRAHFWVNPSYTLIHAQASFFPTGPWPCLCIDPQNDSSLEPCPLCPRLKVFLSSLLCGFHPSPRVASFRACLPAMITNNRMIASFHCVHRL